MRRLCFGGSFNPIHHGHLIVARAAAEALGFERVVLMPSAQPPHKPGSADMAPAAERLAMCRLAVERSDLFEVSDLELRRSGLSYTIDTARALTREGWDRVAWLIGGDTLPLLTGWHEPEALLREVDFVIVARPGWSIDWTLLPPAYHALRSNMVIALVGRLSRSSAVTPASHASVV